MKKASLIIAIAAILFAFTQVNAQVLINATIQINGFTHNWDCGNDGGGGQDPDPRYKVWIGYDGGSFLQSSGTNELSVCSGQGVFGGDDIACTTFNPGIINAYTISSAVANQLNVDMESWEEDGCGSECTKDACTFNSDDTRCGRLRIGDINIWSGPPCTNNIYTGQGSSGNFLSMHNRCSDNNGAGYGINQLIINWSFASSPTILTQPTAVAQGGPDRILCIGTGTTMTVAVNSWNGWSLGQHYQWQVNTLTTNPVPSSGCPVTGWVNIPGATSTSYVPPQTPGTLLYRCIITSNCTTDFTSRTTASECVRITYQPYAAPIVSSVCGLSISPGTPYNFCTTQVPNPGASVGNTYTWTVAPSAGVTIASPTSACTDILFTTNATYTVTLTYGDACLPANASSTCNVTITPSACNTIYVSPTGNDANFGYETTPVATINRAFQLVTGSRTWIRVGEGTYNEANIIQMQNNVILEGGWVNTGGIWTKSTALADATIVNFSGQETISADVVHTVGIKCDNDDNWTIQDITLNTTNATGTTTSGNGKSNMVLYITNGCDNYTISRSRITSGNATNGLGATAGWQGSATYNGVPTDAFDGNNGQAGAGGNNSTANPTCDGCGIGCDQTGGTGGATSAGGIGGNSGAGAAGATGGTGGAGGDGGDDFGSGCNGSFAGGGSTGGGVSAGTGGTPFTGGCTGDGGDHFNATMDGNNAGAAGANGGTGANGTVAVANYATGYFVPGSGANGTAGSAGSGGGGGAGASEDTENIDEPGVGGGGGGAGGGGGGAGRGGGGGGSSYAIFIFNNGTGSVIYDTQINSGTPGTGGIGGNGGTGGAGGGGNFDFLNGGTRLKNQHCGDANYAGGGGDGSAGGNGGNGGSGAAGVNYAISVRGAGTNPTVTTSPPITLNTTPSGGTVPNPINLGVNYYENAKGCTNSEIIISGNATTWTLPGAASFENDINSTTSSYNVNSPSATIIFNAAGVYDITSFSLYNDVIRITDNSRPLPVITVNPSIVCSGSPFSLSATTFGTQIDFEWIIFTNSATNPSDTIATSSQQIPSFVLNVATQTTYNIRYRVKEQCCGWSAPAYATVTVNPPVTTPIAPLGTTTFCIPAGSSVFTTMATNASSYSWSVTGAGNSVIGTSTTGTVFFDPAFSGPGQVCVTANGCAGPTATVCTPFIVNNTVGTPATPVGITSRCIGLGVDTFSTFASGATSYTWSVTGAGNGIGGTTDTSLVSWGSSFSGTAQVCVQANGCGGPSTQVCAFVDVYPAVGMPITPVGVSPICQNAVNSLFISSASDATNYSWSLTPAAAGTITTGNDSVAVDWDPLFSGTATVCVTSSGCSTPQGPVCSNITVDPTVGLPTPISGTQLRCVGPGTDNYSTSSIGATSYTWLLTPVGAGTISPLGVVTWNPVFSGTAIVGVLASGCNGPSDTTFLSVIIDGPVGDPSIPSGTNDRCQGIGSDVYITSASNATSYIWDVTPSTAGTIAGTTSSETVNWDPAYSGSASVCVTAVGCNGNSSQICFTVNIDPAPATPIISVTGLTTFCDGGSTVLTSSSPTNNTWLPNNETTTSITVTQSGTYAVEVTNSFGCTSTSTNQSVVVFPNTINPSINYNDTVCSNSPFNIIASGTNVISYLWNTGDTTAIINPTITSQAAYSVTMTDNNGCTADSTFTIEVYPYPNAVDDNSTTNQDTAVATYVIFNDNMSGTLSVVIDPLHGTAVVTGDSIIYTPDLGYFGTDVFTYALCSKDCPTQCDTATVTIVIDQVMPLVIPGGFSPNGDGQNDLFVIQGLENYPQNSLTIINRWGDIVYMANPYNNDWDGSSNTGINIAGDHVTDGTYFYVFTPVPGADPIKGSLEIRRNN